MAEHILQGQWAWKQLKIHLEWWSPTAGCCTNGEASTWIREVGLPLHFWMGEMFKTIGSQCGGWLETNRIEGDGKEVPKEVKIVENGLSFSIPI
ncbi:unnamed protein product [Withania somnifera]